jgi:hypothetical protein
MAKNSGGFAPNERVNHAIYGLGTISEVNDLHTVIDFDENGRRKFVTSIVRLERTDILAPPPPARRTRSKTAKLSKTKTRDN